MSLTKPDQNNKKWVDLWIIWKISSIFIGTKDQVFEIISGIVPEEMLTKLQKEKKIFIGMKKKEWKNIALSNKEFCFLIDKNEKLSHYMIDDETLSFYKNENLNHDVDFSHSIIDLKKSYSFYDCDFSWAIFKNITWSHVKFKNCNLEEVQFWNIWVQELIFDNSDIYWIKLKENNYEDSIDIEWYSWIQLHEKTSKKVTFSSDFEDEFGTIWSVKKNKKGIIKVKNNEWHIFEIKVLFRKARWLLWVIFLETYKIWNDFLHKDVIYILDNVESKKDLNIKNKLRDTLHKQIDYWNDTNGFNVYPENDNGELEIDLDNNETDLVFKMIRPISMDRKMWPQEDRVFRDDFEWYLKRI